MLDDFGGGELLEVLLQYNLILYILDLELKMAMLLCVDDDMLLSVHSRESQVKRRRCWGVTCISSINSNAFVKHGMNSLSPAKSASNAAETVKVVSHN